MLPLPLGQLEVAQLVPGVEPSIWISNEPFPINGSGPSGQQAFKR